MEDQLLNLKAAVKCEAASVIGKNPAKIENKVIEDLSKYFELLSENAKILGLTKGQTRKYIDLVNFLSMSDDPIATYAAKRRLQKIHCWKIWVP